VHGNLRFTFTGPRLDVEGFGGMACFSWWSRSGRASFAGSLCVSLLLGLKLDAAGQHRQRTIVASGFRYDGGRLLARSARKGHPHPPGLHGTICACRTSHWKWSTRKPHQWPFDCVTV
jgi:hypothetical protein